MPDPHLYLGVKEGQHGENSIHDIAIWNEYGTETIPPRPAFRMGMERGLKKNEKMIRAQLANMFKSGLQKGSYGKKFMRDRQIVMLTQIGKSAVAETKAIIKAGETAPNAPATIKKKGFDHPLFETGVLLNSVEYLVEAE